MDQTKQVPGEPIAKQNVTGLLADAQKQVQGALSLLSSDPEKAKEMLNQVVAAINVAEDKATDPANAKEDNPKAPTEDGGTSTIQAAAGTKPGTAGTQPGTAGTQAPSEAAEAAGATDPGEAAEGEAPEKVKQMFEKFQQQLDAQKAEFEKRLADVKAANAPLVPVPAGDVPPQAPGQPSAMEQALLEGNLTKAVMEAGGEMGQLYDKVDTIVKARLPQMGIRSTKFYVIGQDSGQSQ